MKNGSVFHDGRNISCKFAKFSSKKMEENGLPDRAGLGSYPFHVMNGTFEIGILGSL